MAVKISWYTNANTIGCRLEQKTMYFLMIPLSLSGGSQETKTTEPLEAAAFTPAGGPGTAEEDNTVQFTKYFPVATKLQSFRDLW